MKQELKYEQLLLAKSIAIATPMLVDREQTAEQRRMTAAVELAFVDVPDNLRMGVLHSIVGGKSYPDDAPQEAYSAAEQKCLKNILINMGLLVNEKIQ